MSSPTPHMAIALDSTIGAAFVGHIVTVFLYGVTSVQAFVYYRRCLKDSTALKLSVLGLWILDGIHASLISYAMYWYCITNFSNLRAVQRSIWPIPAMIIVSNISNSIVRCIFGYRLWELRNRKWTLPIIIAIFCVVIVADATYFAIELLSLSSYSGLSHLSWSLYVGLSAEAAVDLIIAVAQCTQLRSLETGVQRTDMLVRTLIAYSINTGLLTSLCAFAALISYAINHANFVYFAFYFILSKLYVNALLARLNARGSLLEGTSRGREAPHSTVVFRSPGVWDAPNLSRGQSCTVEDGGSMIQL